MANLEELLGPIPGANPSGEDVRYLPIFDKLKEARQPGGDWLSEAKPVDYNQVIKIAEEILLKKSKDLQVAVWLAEAYVHRQGIPGFRKGLLLVKGLLENYWDTLYPALEDGSPDMRLGPLDWIGGAYLEIPLKQAPINKDGHGYIQYQESQLVGFMPPEDEYGEQADKQREAHRQAVAEGKVTGEMFQAGFAKTPKQYYVDLCGELESILETIDQLNAFCEQKFPEEPPSFSKLRTTIEQIHLAASTLLEEKRKLEPDPVQETAEQTEVAEQTPAEEEVAVEEAPTQAVTVARVAKRKRAVAGLEPEDAQDAAERLAAVAEWMRSQDPGNPASYLLLRGFRWGELRASGGSPDPALLEPPSTEVRTQIKKLSLEGSYEELIRAGEAAMATAAGRGWLDLQRYVITALLSLGYSAAANAIASALRCLLKDIPDLLNMTLMDDTPTANAETVAWIRENILPPETEPQPQAETPVEAYMPAPPIETPAQAEAASGEPAPPDAFELAMEAARAGDKKQAMEILFREMAQERSGRGKFNRKMQLAQICLSVGQTAIARPILEQLAQEIEQRRLEEWEAADLVAHALSLLYRCLDGEDERRQQVYNWICRLDPVQALACSK